MTTTEKLSPGTPVLIHRKGWSHADWGRVVEHRQVGGVLVAVGPFLLRTELVAAELLTVRA